MKTDISTLPIDMEVRRRGALVEEACRRIQLHAGKQGEAIEQGVQWLAGQGVAMSFKRLETIFYKFKKVGSIACIDRRKVYGKSTGRGIHQPRFKAYWVNLVATFNRSSRAAYEELKNRWRRSEMIPGYEKEWDRKGALPKGWSYENLMKLLPGKQTLGIYRKGMTQAASLLPQFIGTRADSYPLQFVFFDDVWVDRICRYGTEINRAFQLGALDFCTGMRLSASMKFRHRKNDGTHVYFEQDDMLLAVAAFLANDGYNAEKGTTLVVENGTASISPEVEAMLSALSKGKITVDRSGKIGMRQLLRGYGGRAIGNPRHKAPLESWHSLFHNRLCHGPDWAGKDRTPPETVDGIMKAERQHLRNMADLPPERAQLSIGHLLTFGELAQECARVTGEINRREDHELEGWRALGFESAEWTTDPASGMWGDMESIADNPVMLNYVAGLPETHRRVRRWSPLEAWNKTTAKLENKPTRFTAEQVATLLSMSKSGNLCRRVSRNGGYIYWRNNSKWSDAEQYIFEARYVDAMNIPHEAPNQSGLKGVVNPLDPTRLYLFDQNGVLLGECGQVTPARRDDLDAVRRAMGRKNERIADTLQPLRVAMESTEAERENLLSWNRRVADPLAAVTLPDIIQQREDKAAIAVAARRGRRLPAPPAPMPRALSAPPSAALPAYLPPPDAAPGLSSYSPSSFNP